MKNIFLIFVVLLSTYSFADAQKLLDKIDKSLNKVDRTTKTIDNSAKKADNAVTTSTGLADKVTGIFGKKGQSTNKITLVLNNASLKEISSYHTFLQKNELVQESKMKYKQKESVIDVKFVGATVELLEILKMAPDSKIREDYVQEITDNRIVIAFP